MRLDKFVSHATQMSRKQTRQEIKLGNVTVNGNVVLDPAIAVINSDTINHNDCRLVSAQPRYFMLNKPHNVVCATSDPEHVCVNDLLAENGHGLKLAGRLDIDTTGLVLLSDNGQWLHRVTSPNYYCEKVYVATLASPVTADTVKQFETGILLNNEDKPTRPAKLVILNETNCKVTISEGRYHQVKRMFAACENRVINLHRESIGSVFLDPALKSGEFRELTQNEIDSFNSADKNHASL